MATMFKCKQFRIKFSNAKFCDERKAFAQAYMANTPNTVFHDYIDIEGLKICKQCKGIVGQAKHNDNL